MSVFRASWAFVETPLSRIAFAAIRWARLGFVFPAPPPASPASAPYFDDGDGAVRPPNKLCAVLADELVELGGARLFAEDDSGCADGFAVVDLVDADPQMTVEEQRELR